MSRDEIDKVWNIQVLNEMHDDCDDHIYSAQFLSRGPVNWGYRNTKDVEQLDTWVLL